MRLRRSASLALPVLLLPTLVACGSAKVGYGDATTTGFAGVTISGEQGKAPDVTWKSEIAYPSKTQVKTLVEGDGEEVGADDSVSANIWIGDGTTKLQAYSDYATGKPETVNASDMGGEWKTILDGAHYGDRIAGVVASDALFDQAGNPTLGIGTKDSLLVIIDVMDKAAVSPTPSDDKVHDVSPSDMPSLVMKNGKPTGFDFKGLSEPDLTTPVHRVFLKKGTGKKVTANSTVTIDYLGQTFGAKEPFDANYTAKGYTSPLANLVKGWQIGLEGVPVGSRVILSMPPAFGYGAEGSGDKIGGNATLWFVIDVLKTS